jgi:tetratricopeptide (TPR) repeat protein
MATDFARQRQLYFIADRFYAAGKNALSALARILESGPEDSPAACFDRLLKIADIRDLLEEQGLPRFAEYKTEHARKFHDKPEASALEIYCLACLDKALMPGLSPAEQCRFLDLAIILDRQEALAFSYPAKLVAGLPEEIRCCYENFRAAIIHQLADRHYLEAKALFGGGRYAQAKECLQAAIDLVDTDPRFFVLSGRLAMAQEDYDGAVSRFRWVITNTPKEPNSFAAYTCLIDILLNHFDQVNQNQEEVMVEAASKMPDLYLSHHDPIKKALYFAQQLSAFFPKKAQSWETYAEVCFAAGQDNDAVRMLSTAQRMEPNNPELLDRQNFYELRALMKDGQKESAIILAKQLWSLSDPDNVIFNMLENLFHPLTHPS